MVNFFVQMPYEQEGMSKRFLVDKDHLKLIQVGLSQARACRSIPLVEMSISLPYKARSSLTPKVWMPLRMKGRIPVEYNTSRHVQNTSQGDVTFLIIKTPVPADAK